MTEEKITKLNLSQKALIPVVRDEWLSRCDDGQPINKEAAIAGINWVYKLSNLAEPQILFVSSPLAAQYAAHLLKNMNPKLVLDQVRDQVSDRVQDQVSDQVWDQVRNQVSDQVLAQVSAQVSGLVQDQVRNQVSGQVWDQVTAQVAGQVWDRVQDQVLAQVSDQVSAQVQDQGLSTTKKPLVWGPFGVYVGISDYFWVAFYDFFARIGVKLSENFEPFKQLLISGIYDTIQLRSLCIACEKPQHIYRDVNKRVHSATQPAISWRDGYQLHFLHGVFFKEDLWQKIVGEAFSTKDLLSLTNMEQRMAALKTIGVSRFLKDATLVKTSTRGNSLYLLKEVFDEPAYYLRYVCPSTGREYVSGVPPEVGINGNPDECMSWKLGLTTNEYGELVIEA